MVDYMRSHAIEGPWPPANGCWSASRAAARPSATVRHAKRLADQLRAPWTAINVETTGSARASAAGAGQRRRGAAAGAAPGRRTGADPRPGRRRLGHRLRPRQQRHPPHRRQVGPAALAAVAARFDHPAADQPRRRHQHPCHRGAAGAQPTRRHTPPREPRAAARPAGPTSIATLLVAAGDPGRRSACTRCWASPTSRWCS